jgi:HEAT repeat protein
MAQAETRDNERHYKLQPAAVAGLVEALRDTDYLVCDVAAWTLAQIGRPAVAGLLEALHG